MTKRQKLRESRGRLETNSRRLQRSEVELFAAGIAHEFNNVLGAALGHAEWALDSGAPQDMKESLELVVKACERAREITWALKGLAQPREERLAQIKLGKLLDEVTAWAEPFLQHDDIELRVEPLDEIGFEGDFEQLKEIVMNLIKNSRDSLCERGSADGSPLLCVSLLPIRHGDELWIRVRDNGVGVPAEYRETIFQPFFTTKGSMKHVAAASSMGDGEGKKLGGGMGLGLYMARNAAREHGGDLVLAANLPLEFVLKLPLS